MLLISNSRPLRPATTKRRFFFDDGEEALIFWEAGLNIEIEAEFLPVGRWFKIEGGDNPIFFHGIGAALTGEFVVLHFDGDAVVIAGAAGNEDGVFADGEGDFDAADDFLGEADVVIEEGVADEAARDAGFGGFGVHGKEAAGIPAGGDKVVHIFDVPALWDVAWADEIGAGEGGGSSEGEGLAGAGIFGEEDAAVIGAEEQIEVTVAIPVGQFGADEGAEREFVAIEGDGEFVGHEEAFFFIGGIEGFVGVEVDVADAVADDEVLIAIAIEITECGDELFAAGAIGEPIAFVGREDGDAGAAGIAEEVDGVGGVGAVADDEIRFAVTGDVVDKGGGEIANGKGIAAGHDLGEGFGLVLDLIIGGDGISGSELAVAEVFTPHDAAGDVAADEVEELVVIPVEQSDGETIAEVSGEEAGLGDGAVFRLRAE